LSGLGHWAVPGLRSRAAVIAAIFLLGTVTWAQAQEEGPATSKGENFSAKPPAALFNSDCTGSDCHRGPQGLSKGKTQGGLAGFLREHYTNSRESAAALAAYLVRLPAGPEPREARSPRSREAAPARSAPEETRAPREHPAARTSRTSAKPESAKPEEEGTPAQRRAVAEPAAAPPKSPAARNARAQRGRQPPAAEAAPPPEPAPPEPPPAPKQYDIFD